jgi:hypothetical protein
MASPIGKLSMRARDACLISPSGHLGRWLCGVVLVCGVGVACQSTTRDTDAPQPSPSGAGMSSNPANSPPVESARTGTAGAASSVPTLTKDAPTLRVSECAPCRFVAAAGTAFDVSFKTGADQSVERLGVKTSEGATSQVGGGQNFGLKDAWSPTGEFLLQAIDINFDGVLDFAFGPIMGTPNLELHYWRVDIATAQLAEVGRFSNLKVRADTRELETSEKGGHAGLLFKNEAYRWVDGHLVRVRSVEQTEGARAGHYRKTTRVFDGGKVVSESAEDVKAPQQ